MEKDGERQRRPSRRSLLSNRYKLITNVRSSLMAVNIHITIIELNALHTKRQNLFQELDAVIHLLMEAKHWGLRKSRNATSLDRKSGSAGMPRPISYAVFCLKKKKTTNTGSNSIPSQYVISVTSSRGVSCKSVSLRPVAPK